MLAAQAVGDMDLGTVYEVLIQPCVDGLSHMAAAAAAKKAAQATAVGIHEVTHCRSSNLDIYIKYNHGGRSKLELWFPHILLRQ
jgi:hypothetical protein